jgi:hypothetical protein
MYIYVQGMYHDTRTLLEEIKSQLRVREDEEHSFVSQQVSSELSVARLECERLREKIGDLEDGKANDLMRWDLAEVLVYAALSY